MVRPSGSSLRLLTVMPSEAVTPQDTADAVIVPSSPTFTELASGTSR